MVRINSNNVSGIVITRQILLPSGLCRSEAHSRFRTLSLARSKSLTLSFDLFLCGKQSHAMVGYLLCCAGICGNLNRTMGQKNQSLLEMLKSAKDCSQDEELDNEETFILKKESSNTQTGTFSAFFSLFFWKTLELLLVRSYLSCSFVLL